jgi:hypothetical protein
LLEKITQFDVHFKLDVSFFGVVLNHLEDIFQLLLLLLLLIVLLVVVLVTLLVAFGVF